MSAIFLKLLNMSIAASWIVLAVVVLRLLFKNTPKWITCLLWGILALRLLLPFTLESIFSLIPSSEVIPLNIAQSQTPAIYSGISVVNSAVNPLFTGALLPGNGVLERILQIALVVWLVGIVLLVGYVTITYFHLHRKVRASILLRDNIYICDAIDTPFILGIIHPRIYIPSGMDEEQLQHVLAHENAHLKRKDHLWKPLGFLLLTLYWFNPLLWLSYNLLCRDIEKACDEKVIAEMDAAGKKGYSAALLACSVHRRNMWACPLAFGEVGIKTRIKGVLSFQKPAFWIIVFSLILCSTAAVCFLTNPITCVHAYTADVTTAPSCTSLGVQTHTCQQCEHSYTTSVAMLSHAYAESRVLTAPTCTQEGVQEFACLNCGDTKTEPLAATGHTDGELVVSKEPNCTETGERSTTCIVCQTTYVVEILETNGVHVFEETVLKEATCSSPGEGLKVCTLCDHTETCVYEQLEHTFVLLREIPPSCYCPGEHVEVCTVCGEVKSTLIPKLAHKYVRKNWFDNYMTCSVCKDVKYD